MHLPSVESKTILSQVVATSLVKELILAIARTDEPGFYITVDAAGDELVRSSSLYEFIKYIPQFEVTLTYPRDDYLAVFWQACQEVGLEFSPFGIVSLNSTETGYLGTPQTINALVDKIRQLNC